MAKFLLPILFVLLLALNVAGFAFLTMDLDGSTVTHKRTTTQPNVLQRRP